MKDITDLLFRRLSAIADKGHLRVRTGAQCDLRRVTPMPVPIPCAQCYFLEARIMASSTLRRPWTLQRSGAPLMAVTLAALLGGCVIRVASPPPPEPPPPAYNPPPPPPAEPVAEEGVQASEAPPPLPEYEQPACPGDGYLWTPGYWRWYAGGYYWVPGTWVMPPTVGVYWTPPYWGFVGGVYVFHAGYWGPHVGFYGGVNYGYGYGGVGFVGGHWAGNSFAYNRAVVNVNTTVVHNTYNTTVVNNVTVVNRVSYNGGAGGLTAVPTSQERIAARESHVSPTPLQQQHVQQAVRNPDLAAHANGGRPAIAATVRPAAFHGPEVVGARGAAPMAATNSAAQRPNTAFNAHNGVNAAGNNAPPGGRPPVPGQGIAGRPAARYSPPPHPAGNAGNTPAATPRVPANGGGTAATAYNAKGSGGYAPPRQQVKGNKAPAANHEHDHER